MKIILAVDGSRESGWAADLLLGLPLAEDPEIRVLHVVDLSKLESYFIPGRDALKYGRAIHRETRKALSEAEGLAGRLADRLRPRWKKVGPVIREGRTAQSIIEFAGLEKADLIVLGSRGLGRMQTFRAGSISQMVSTYAPCSVLVAKQRCRVVNDVLIGFDGSDYAKKAVKFLNRIFSPGKIEVTVLHALESPLQVGLKKVAEVEEEYLRRMMRRAGMKGDILLVSGHPAKRLLEVAGGKEADLVAVGSRGRTGLKRFLLGSVSHKVMIDSPVSVLIVK